MTALPRSVRTRTVNLLMGLALLLLALGAPSSAWAGPVDWQEVAATEAGRQWWDAGSLRVDRHGHLTVLSRFQPSTATGPSDTSAAPRPAPGRLYVMELDCDRELYRDTAVNGIPRLRAPWLTPEDDLLTLETVRASCRAGADLLLAANHG